MKEQDFIIKKLNSENQELIAIVKQKDEIITKYEKQGEEKSSKKEMGKELAKTKK